MKMLIKLRFIQKLAEIPSIKFTIKFGQKILLATQGKKKNLLVNLSWINLILDPRELEAKEVEEQLEKTPVFTHKFFILFLSELQMLSLFFGLLKRDGKVYVEIVKTAQRNN